MRQDIISLLSRLNQKFYNEFASSFATSRGQTEPGLDQILRDVRAGQALLDLGCGHGRVARLLPAGCTYVGLDFSSEILKLAQSKIETAIPTIKTQLIMANLLDPMWTKQVQGQYDWIVLRAVLHHIPGLESRSGILKRATKLLASQGKLVIANWQFLEIKRLRRRLCDWEQIGITAEDVEPGDYLLDWQRDGHGLRYVHWVNETETHMLARRAGLSVANLFRADGHQNNLTLYAVLEPRSH